jgi:hypothetical protein
MIQQEKQFKRVDKGNGQSPRIVMPALGKLPVTPRLAANTINQTTQRKSRTTDNNGPRQPLREENITPLRAQLSPNVTPRSSTRRNRVSQHDGNTEASLSPSLASSPVLTDGGQRYPIFEASSRYSGRTEVFQAGLEGPSKSEVQLQYSPRATDLESTSSKHVPEPQEPSSGKFFHASEIGSAITATRPVSPMRIGPVKAPTFFYANQAAASLRSEMQNAGTMPKRTQTIPEGRDLSNRRHQKTGSVTLESRSDISGLPYPQIQPLLSMYQKVDQPPAISPKFFVPLSIQRSPSPVRDIDGPAVDFENRLLEPSAVVTGAESDVSRRRSDTPYKSHNPVSFSTSRRNSRPMSQSSLASSDISNPNVELGYSDHMETKGSAFAPQVELARPALFASPSGKLAMAPKEAMSETFAANARRERKVLDLEISNNSLLAINRSLEREMRKQTLELRRYKRLSRSGRLSLTPAKHIPKARDASIAEPEVPSEESQSEFCSSDDADDSSDNGITDDEISQRKAARDEKRLMADLSRHRELLVASQKMNESLKRCLNWTDELIKEGKRALHYTVCVSDVGGRVLSPEEIDETHVTDIFALKLDGDSGQGAASERTIQITERDSGVDLGLASTEIPIVAD